MTYRVTYRDDGWMPAANGTPEWRQVVSTDLGDGTTLVVVIVRSARGGLPRVAEARIESPTSPGQRAGSDRLSSGCAHKRLNIFNIECFSMQ